MDKRERALRPRSLLAVLAVVLAAAAFWAASALAAGGSSPNDGSTSDRPAAANVQSTQDESEARDDNCPNRGSDSESGSGA